MHSLREKCPHLEFFWSAFSLIGTEYGEILRYSVSLRIESECVKIRTRKTPNMDTFHAVTCLKNIYILHPSFLRVEILHENCVKSWWMRSFYGSYFPYSVWIPENMDQIKLVLRTFDAVKWRVLRTIIG